jgi:hypothetical protein
MDNGVLPFKQCGPIGVKPRQIPGMDGTGAFGAVQTRNIVAERHEMSSKFRSQMPRGSCHENLHAHSKISHLCK